MTFVTKHFRWARTHTKTPNTSTMFLASKSKS